MSQRMSTAACAEACLFSSCGGGMFCILFSAVVLCCVVMCRGCQGSVRCEVLWLKDWRGGLGLLRLTAREQHMPPALCNTKRLGCWTEHTWLI